MAGIQKIDRKAMSDTSCRAGLLDAGVGVRVISLYLHIGV